MFVGNLPWAAAEGDLESLFSQVGRVETVHVMRDKFTGRARGFAFVTMSSSEEAEEAVRRFEGQSFMGRPLKVNIARPLEDNPPRQHGGGGDRHHGGGGHGGGYGGGGHGGGYGGGGHGGGDSRGGGGDRRRFSR